MERTNVLLEVAQDVRVDLTLSPGEQTQTVTVTAESPSIDTTNATLGGTVTNQAVTSLPLVTRNFLDLLELRPGVVSVPGTPSTTTTNGRRTGSDVLLIEGVTQFDLATANVLINGAQKGNAVDQLPLDSVQEFSTQQNPQAEYGWRDGSGVTVAVKVWNQQHSRVGLCLRPRCSGDRCEAVFRAPGARAGWQLDGGAARLHARWPANQEQAFLVCLRGIYPSVQF